MTSFDATSDRIGVRRPAQTDREELIALMQASREFHDPWVDMPNTPERFAAYLPSPPIAHRRRLSSCDLASAQIVGPGRLNLHRARLFFNPRITGYCVGAPFARQGYMTEGIKLVTQYAFTAMGLHRVEANIQPGNAASIALVRKCGFRKEGFSPRYLKVKGEWRDHERWALLANEIG